MEIRSPANQLFPPKFMVSFVANRFRDETLQILTVIPSTQFTQISCCVLGFSMVAILRNKLRPKRPPLRY